jgi:hypothetical protein
MAVLPAVSALDPPEGAFAEPAVPEAPGGSGAADPNGTRAELATLVDATARAEDYAGRSKSSATIKAYASGWRDFLNFCE